MKRFAALLLVLLLTACSSQHIARRDHAPLPLIPLPATVERAPGHFAFHRGLPIVVRSGNALALGAARYFQQLVADLHLDLRVDGVEADGAIAFVIDPNLTVRDDASDESYELSVSPRRIRVSARSPRGLFYGGITLWQLISATDEATPLQIPAVAISDHPRFAWRGLLLDSARHFQSPEFVKRFIDQMAQHKLNVLHWHLTDDQGWRVEIRKYPLLTQVGAWRTPPGGGAAYGGFYTQDEIRDIVRYAQERYVTIVPEIEMPGHAQAAIAAYPQFGVTGRNPGVSHDWGINTYLYNVDESTFGFLQDVLDEVMELFPSPYIHVGGDEAAKDQWQASARAQERMRELGLKDDAALQGWFTARIGKYLAAHGRKLIGWDDILEGGSVPPDATVMSWRGAQGAIDAAKRGHDVIMAPSPVMYLDHLQSSAHDEPPGRPDVVSLEDVYRFEPVPHELDSAQAAHVLGAEAALWSEYLTDTQRLEHAAFPRTAALAEALWSEQQRRDWASFQARLPAQLARYARAGVAYARATESAAPADPLERNSDELKPCANGLSLRIQGDPDGSRDGPVYHVDLMNPCWIFTRVDLDRTAHIVVQAGHIPYYFALWHDEAKVIMRKPMNGGDELQIHLDDCSGPLFRPVPLRIEHAELETFDVPLAGTGVHDLCFTFATRARDPLWLIDFVRLVPK
jgi:hexosaminidase